ncbi:MAG: acetate--CoA ligase family protein [Proteobacteria bacterium]|nr:acetate--CoA ligase family protein [Pseudomonadota bacterium]
MHLADNIEALLNPTSVAVVGASRTQGKTGYAVLKGLIDSGYKGEILPVNPAGGKVLDLPLVTDVSELPDGLDLALICLPRAKVLATMTTLAEKGLRAAVVMASGFKETGREGYYIEEELARLVRKYNIALLGPNSLGLMNTAINLNATTTPDMPQTGNVAFFSQSGALCFAAMDWALGTDFGFSTFVHLGNKAVINESHMLAALADDPATKVIMAHIESVEGGQEFMREAEKVTAKKPVIMLKAGTTPAGARAVSDHTGSLAGSRDAYEAAFTQSGIIQVDEVRTLFRLAQAFSTQPLPLGPNLAVITNSGGPGILAADACENSQLNLVRPSPATLDALRDALPPYASLYNPIDIIGDASAERYRVTLEAVAADERVHCIMVLLSPTASVEIEATAQAVIDIHRRTEKPMFVCFMGAERIRLAQELFREAGIPCYGFPEQAVQALEAMYNYYQWQNRAFPVDVCFRRDKGRAERVINAARKLGLTELMDLKAMDLGAAYELPYPETVLARTSERAVRAAKKMGFPVALKVASPHIPYKTDVDGVALNLSGPNEVRQAFGDITARAARRRNGSFITGCMVQSMAPRNARDVMVEFRRDAQFGPLIRFGLGGVHTEVLNDWSKRLAPLTLNDAQNMVREITAYPLLRGVRGEESVDISAIEDVLLTVSQMAMDFPEIEDATIGPIMVNHDGALVVDMRVTLSPKD